MKATLYKRTFSGQIYFAPDATKATRERIIETLSSYVDALANADADFDGWLKIDLSSRAAKGFQRFDVAGRFVGERTGLHFKEFNPIASGLHLCDEGMKKLCGWIPRKALFVRVTALTESEIE